MLTPLAIGFALFATQLAGIRYTGGAVNTARAFGSAVASRDFSRSHWLYWVGPSLGAILAAGLHKVMHAVHCRLESPADVVVLDGAYSLVLSCTRLGAQPWFRCSESCAVP